MSKGITVSLGTDGAAHGGLSLWNEMKIFRSVMNLHFGVPLSNPAVMPAKTILKMATVNGQKCLGNPNGGVIRAHHVSEHGFSSSRPVRSIRDNHGYARSENRRRRQSPAVPRSYPRTYI